MILRQFKPGEIIPPGALCRLLFCDDTWDEAKEAVGKAYVEDPDGTILYAKEIQSKEELKFAITEGLIFFSDKERGAPLVYHRRRKVY